MIFLECFHWVRDPRNLHPRMHVHTHTHTHTREYRCNSSPMPLSGGLSREEVDLCVAYMAHVHPDAHVTPVMHCALYKIFC
mgnify:CR=1 FL=1